MKRFIYANWFIGLISISAGVRVNEWRRIFYLGGNYVWA